MRTGHSPSDTRIDELPCFRADSGCGMNFFGTLHPSTFSLNGLPAVNSIHPANLHSVSEPAREVELDSSPRDQIFVRGGTHDGCNLFYCIERRRLKWIQVYETRSNLISRTTLSFSETLSLAFSEALALALSFAETFSFTLSALLRDILMGVSETRIV